MRVELGTEVRTRDGKDVGKIEKLILNPQTGDVTAAVVRKGFILTDDVEIPIEALEAGREGEARLTYSAEEVDKLPRFMEANYTSPSPDFTPPIGYAPGGLLWPASYPVGVPAAGADYGYDVDRATADELDASRRDRDYMSAIIDEGSDVMSRDGEKVGDVHRVSVDTATGRPISFVVRKGFLFTEDLELPASLIESVDDGVVYLNVDKDHVAEAAKASESGYPRSML
jgi:sporulation protein YlmC with PRC-barrel domain